MTQNELKASGFGRDFSALRRAVGDSITMATTQRLGDQSHTISIRQADWSALLDYLAFTLLKLENAKELAMDVKDRLAKLEAATPSQLAYRGVWQRAGAYPRGVVVTFAGSAWIALRATEEGEAPGEVPAAWQLMVRAGRDGKDAGEARR